jgi:hypothetical protein
MNENQTLQSRLAEAEELLRRCKEQVSTAKDTLLYKDIIAFLSPTTPEAEASGPKMVTVRREDLESAIGAIESTFDLYKELNLKFNMVTILGAVKQLNRLKAALEEKP